nr:hypothetical protein [Tanacetum cinerariifolium]
MVLEKDFASFDLQEMEIHPLMIIIRTLSMILQTFSPTLHNPIRDKLIDVNPLFDKVLENIENKDSYDSNLDEPDLLVTPLFDANEDECFDPGGDIDEIDAFDIPLDFKDGYYDSKGDVLYLNSMLSDDTTLNLPPKEFLDRDPRSLSDINDLKIRVEVFDLGIPEKFFSLTNSEDTIVDPDIFAFQFSLEPVAFHRSGTFMITPDYEDSHAHDVVHRPLKLLSLGMLIYGNPIS